MSNQLHHVVLRSHSAKTLIAFLKQAAGMSVQQELRLPSELLQTTLGWPPSDGADVVILGSGDAGLIEIIDVPASLRDEVPEGLAALSFMTDDFTKAYEDASSYSTDVTIFDATVPDVDLLFCTVAGVKVEFMSKYVEDASSYLN